MKLEGDGWHLLVFVVGLMVGTVLPWEVIFGIVAILGVKVLLAVRAGNNRPEEAVGWTCTCERPGMQYSTDGTMIRRQDLVGTCRNCGNGPDQHVPMSNRYVWWEEGR